MPLARFDAPFEHPDWIFEPKLDGFRAVAYAQGGACRLVSRNRNAFKTFEPLGTEYWLRRRELFYGAPQNSFFLGGVKTHADGSQIDSG